MFYAARTDSLSDILLPNPCLVEDGFLAACLVTGLFEHEPDEELVLAAPDVFHRYEERSELTRLLQPQRAPGGWDGDERRSFHAPLEGREQGIAERPAGALLSRRIDGRGVRRLPAS